MMSKGQEVLYEGWLTKSPPTKRVWRGRWRRRWFALQPGEIPGQFILIYYTDRNCRKIKGSIDLEHCEQVDSGLKFDEGKLKFDFLFDIKTPHRTYYLAADSESEMKAWVKNICGVCNLKPTSDDDDVFLTSTTNSTLNRSNDVPVLQLDISKSQENRYNVSPTSPNVSKSPYIPISECITGKSPLLPGQRITDFQALLQHNLRNTAKFKPNSNQNEENNFPTYLNLNMEPDPQSYDLPRLLQPPIKRYELRNCKNSSESVFSDEEWPNTTLSSHASNPRPSDSSNDGELQKSPVENLRLCAPPRPPKPQGILSQANYLNLPSATNARDSNSSFRKDSFEENVQPTTTDEMYDFPRNHQIDSVEFVKNSLWKRHCYNNAAPSNVEGKIFRYDISPKPSTSSSQIFRYDLDENQDEPASPLSQSSSSAAYSNLPSPLLPDCKLMPPPVVNRGLKPKRKTSDAISLASTTEPSSPRPAPSVDRTLKPSKTLPSKASKEAKQRGHIRKYSEPSQQSFKRSFESFLSDSEQIYYPDERKNYYKLEYLDLDLENVNSNFTNVKLEQPLRSPGAGTVYKKVDFTKTEAFNITRNNLEKERKETEPFLKK